MAVKVGFSLSMRRLPVTYLLSVSKRKTIAPKRKTHRQPKGFIEKY
jgi:hypothetical protein